MDQKMCGCVSFVVRVRYCDTKKWEQNLTVNPVFGFSLEIETLRWTRKRKEFHAYILYCMVRRTWFIQNSTILLHTVPILSTLSLSRIACGLHQRVRTIPDSGCSSALLLDNTSESRPSSFVSSIHFKSLRSSDRTWSGRKKAAKKDPAVCIS
jgi:hypothetical protein